MTLRQEQIVDTDRQDRKNKNITEDVIIHLEATCATALYPSSSICSAFPL